MWPWFRSAILAFKYGFELIVFGISSLPCQTYATGSFEIWDSVDENILTENGKVVCFLSYFCLLMLFLFLAFFFAWPEARLGAGLSGKAWGPGMVWHQVLELGYSLRPSDDARHHLWFAVCRSPILTCFLGGIVMPQGTATATSGETRTARQSRKEMRWLKLGLLPSQSQCLAVN